MSEINAIATNNYLLATQQEVSHDNTLSGNGTVDSPLGVANNAWVQIENSEVNYNTSVINAGGFRLFYNPFLKMVSLTCDVQIKAGSVSDRIMTWSDRLTPVDPLQFALGNGLSLYVSNTTLNQPAAASQRWLNGCWCWAVKGE